MARFAGLCFPPCVKSLGLVLVAFLLPTIAHAQGIVSFDNRFSTNYRLWTNNVSGTASNLMSGVNAFRIGLYVSTDLDAAEGALSLVGLATNAAFAGYFAGGNPFSLPNGYENGIPIRFQLRAWSFAGGLSWDEAVAMAQADPLRISLGASPFGTAVPGGGGVPPFPLFGTDPGQLLTGFEIRPIPEPSVLALALLGLVAGSAFACRRARRLATGSRAAARQCA